MRTMLRCTRLLGIALLISVASASAESTKATVPTPAGRAGSAEFAAAEVTALSSIHMLGSTFRGVGRVHSADSLSNGPASPLSTLVFEPFQLGSNDGDDHEHNYNNNRKNDSDSANDRSNVRDHDTAPTPAPKPLMAVLFGAAMLIGGGILRRRRRAGQNLKHSKKHNKVRA
jgi:hypothetical protein